MKKLFFIIALLLLTPSLASAACDYYASNRTTAGGTGTAVNPYRISDFLALSAGTIQGKTLCLQDGTYTGATGMIQPPAGTPGLSGTANARITIQAEHDGAVLLDGQLALDPVEFHGNSYFTLIGFDAAHGVDSVVYFATASNYNEVKRVVAWDSYPPGAPAPNHDADIFSNSHNDGNLLEDVAGFGRGRKIFSTSQNGNNYTIRRAWGMWNSSYDYGQANDSPRGTFQFGYNAYNNIYENVIGTWDGQVESPTAYAVLYADGFYQGFDYCANTKLLGSIAYFKTGQNIPGYFAGGLGYMIRSLDCMTYKDNVYSAGPFTTRPITAEAFSGGNYDATCASEPGGCKRYLTDITTIGSTTDSIDQSVDGWTVNNVVHVTPPSTPPNPFQTTTGSGARVCWQYKGGVLQTGTPLWPWPMDARIRQALTRSGRNPDTVFGGAGNGVTQQMEALFGSTKACQGAAAIVSVSITDPAKDGMVVNAQSYPMLGTSNLP